MRLTVLLVLAVLPAAAVPVAHAALDDFAGPLVPDGQLLYTHQTEYFHTQERGEHGSAIFGAFDSEPDFWSIGNKLRFSPAAGTEITLGLTKNFSFTYQRLTYNPAGDLVFLNSYRSDQFPEFQADVRYRRGDREYFVESYGNRQNAGWHSAPGNVEADFFTDIESRFEDISAGVRFAGERTDVEARLRYRGGKIRRTNEYYGTSPSTRRNYYHDLRGHLTPEVRINHRWTDRVTVHTGAAYTTPYKYKFEFQQFNPGGTTKFISATYRLTQQFFFPLGIQLTGPAGWLFKVSSDLTVAKQRLDGYIKDFSDALSVEPERELIYYQTRPTLEVSYTRPTDREGRAEVLGPLTKPLLRKNQYRVSLSVRQDITSLDKNEFNGSQNIIDPYNAFKYPLDNFVAGTQHAAFLAGNSSSSFSQIGAQDFTRVEAGIAYGLTDRLNTELRGGFQSRSTAHQYVFDNNASNRHYVFEPYYFMQWITDWQIGEDNRLSLDMYYVPQYKTFLNTDVHPRGFEVENEYFQATVVFEKLF